MVSFIPVKVIVDQGKCNLCGLCIELCPASVFSREGESIVADSDKCIECYGCIPLCPVRAISINIEENKGLERFVKHVKNN